MNHHKPRHASYFGGRSARIGPNVHKSAYDASARRNAALVSSGMHDFKPLRIKVAKAVEET